MSRTKPKTEPPSLPAPDPAMNGPAGDVLTLSEAALYLRLPEADVMRMVRQGRSRPANWMLVRSVRYASAAADLGADSATRFPAGAGVLAWDGRSMAISACLRRPARQR